MNLEELTLEEKVDLILKYQIKALRWQRAKMIFSLILFFIIVVLPIILFVHLMKSFDFSGLGENLNAMKELYGIGSVVQDINTDSVNVNLDSIEDILNSLGN